MVERAKYEKELNEMSEERRICKCLMTLRRRRERGEEDEEAVEEIKPSKGKGKQKAEDDSQIGVKRRRPRMDPFAG
jgi:hypothetical protein